MQTTLNPQESQSSSCTVCGKCGCVMWYDRPHLCLPMSPTTYPYTSPQFTFRRTEDGYVIIRPNGFEMTPEELVTSLNSLIGGQNASY